MTGEPNAVEPSINCTDPAALGVTVAVKVTDVPTVVGLAGVAPSVVDVATAGAVGVTEFEDVDNAEVPSALVAETLNL